jgi:hypothetical protein
MRHALCGSYLEWANFFKDDPKSQYPKPDPGTSLFDQQVTRPAKKLLNPQVRTKVLISV